METWEKLKALSTVLAAVVIPVVVLIVGNNYTAAIKERELQGKYVELAVAILREAPSQDTRNLRSWATQIINAYSGVPLSAQTQQDLIERMPLIHLGSIGAPVTDIQRMLKDLGYYSGPLDNVAGPTFRQALVAFQKDNEMIPDGIVGPGTYIKLKEAHEKQKAGNK